MRRASGLSMLEVLVAFAVLALVALGMLAMVSSSQRMSGLTRERSVAMNAVNGYIEAMRSKTIGQIYNDRTTPANYLPTDKVWLKNPVGEVYLGMDETGDTAVLVSGGLTSTVDFTATSTQLLFARDLDGDGASTTVFDSTTVTSMIVLPAMVKLSWDSMVGDRAGSERKMSVVMYVAFGT
jgi:Tfp pilus assembly protein PilV